MLKLKEVKRSGMITTDSDFIGNSERKGIFFIFVLLLSCSIVGVVSCGSSLYEDIDGDGFSDVAFGGRDCNDGDPAINPGAIEWCTDGIDNNCDGKVDDCITLYKNDFTREEDVDSLNKLPRLTHRVEDKKLILMAGGYFSGLIFIPQSFGYKDYEISLRMRLASSDQVSGQVFGAYQILFRLASIDSLKMQTDSTYVASLSGQRSKLESGYGITIGKNNDGAYAYTSNLFLGSKSEEILQSLASKADLEWHIYNIKAMGDRVIISVDGYKYIDVIEYSYDSGGIAIGLFPWTEIEIDYIKVMGNNKTNIINDNKTVIGDKLFLECGKTCGENQIYSNSGECLFVDNIWAERHACLHKFYDNKNGTVTVNDSLIWEQEGSIDAMRWEEAVRYCENLELASFENWRLPTIVEMFELFTIKEYAKYIEGKYWYSLYINTLYFPDSYSPYYWIFDLQNNDSYVADLSWGSFGKSIRLDPGEELHNVRCVRDND